MDKITDKRTWSITNHICRACLGRVLHHESFDHRMLWRCSNCGIEREGPAETSLCMCGLTLRTKINAGIRCMVNPQKTPECPSEVVAREVRPDGAGLR